MSSFPEEDLARSSARSRAADLIQQSPLIQGTTVESERTCGTSTCRCHGKGPKHSATYLAVRYAGKRTMICVPKRLLTHVRECVNNHQRLQQTLEIISRDCLDVFLLKKTDSGTVSNYIFCHASQTATERSGRRLPCHAV